MGEGGRLVGWGLERWMSSGCIDGEWWGGAEASGLLDG